MKLSGDAAAIEMGGGAANCIANGLSRGGSVYGIYNDNMEALGAVVFTPRRVEPFCVNFSHAQIKGENLKHALNGIVEKELKQVDAFKAVVELPANGETGLPDGFVQVGKLTQECWTQHGAVDILIFEYLAPDYKAVVSENLGETFAIDPEDSYEEAEDEAQELTPA